MRVTSQRGVCTFIVHHAWAALPSPSICARAIFEMEPERGTGTQQSFGAAPSDSEHDAAMAAKVGPLRASVLEQKMSKGRSSWLETISYIHLPSPSNSPTGLNRVVRATACLQAPRTSAYAGASAGKGRTTAEEFCTHSTYTARHDHSHNEIAGCLRKGASSEVFRNHCTMLAGTT